MQTAGLHIDNPLSLVNLVTSPLTERTSFAVCLSCCFTAENKIKQKIRQNNLLIQSLSQLRWQLSLPKRALQFVRFEMMIYSQTILPKRADFTVLCKLSLFFTTQLYHKKMTASISFQSSCSHPFLDCFFTAPLFIPSQSFVSLINFKKPIYYLLFSLFSAQSKGSK